jgi:hypothetical protein
MRTLDKISALNPAIVVPGHKTADRANDPAALKFMKSYLADFDAAIAASKTAADLMTRVKQNYPGLQLEIILQIGANAAIPTAATK